MISIINYTNKYPFVRNKYILASVLFFIWVGFIDENSLIDRFRLEKEHQILIDDKAYYSKKIKQDTYEMEELEVNKNLEVIAREKYLMKKADEDIFVIKSN